MKRIALLVVLLALLSGQTPAWASALKPSSNLAHFEAVCLKANNLCRYIELDFANDGTVEAHTVVFLPLANRAAATFWNDRDRRSALPSAHENVDIAVYNSKTGKWTPVTGSEQCPLCVPDNLLNGSSKRWVSFRTDHVSTWRSAGAIWRFERIVARGEQQKLYVVVKSPNGPVVYASMRNSGMHYHYSTRQTGKFRMLLESDWVMSARPDYVVISPTRSWADVAHAYMHTQGKMLTGSEQLPEFTGSAKQIVDKAIDYIASRGIGYDKKFDAAAYYPNETVAEILGIRKTDCKGFATLLYALLRKSGVKSAPVLLNAVGMTPLSFGVPDDWADHAILYVPAINRYIDPALVVGSHGEYTWQTSADPYVNDVVLNLATGHFEVVPDRPGQQEGLTQYPGGTKIRAPKGAQARVGTTLHQP